MGININFFHHIEYWSYVIYYWIENVPRFPIEIKYVSLIINYYQIIALYSL